MNPLQFLVDWLNGTTPVPNVTPLVHVTLTVTDPTSPNTPLTYSGWATVLKPGFPESGLQVTAILVAGSPVPYGAAQFTTQLMGVASKTRKSKPFVEFLPQPVFTGPANNPHP